MTTLLATLTATDLAAVVAAVVSLAAIVALVVLVMSVLRTLRELRATLAEVRAETLPVLDDLRRAVLEANDDLERVDDLIGSAEALSATVDSAARLGYLTVGKPVIKTMAFAKGTSRAARRLRSREVS